MKTRLNPFALRHMLKHRDEEIDDLRRSVRFLLPLAEEAVGAYPPYQIDSIKDGIKTVKVILRNTAKPKKKKK